MAMEDCGVLVQVLKHFCCKGGKQAFDGSDANLTLAANAYQDIRIARTKRILGSSHTIGKTQQMRADSWWYNFKREWEIRLNVALHGTLPIMRPGAAYNYVTDVEAYVKGPDEYKAKAAIPPPPPPPIVSLEKVKYGLLAAVAVTAVAVIVARRK